MNLGKLDRKILRHIEKMFPIPWEDSAREYLKIGERNLPTKLQIRTEFRLWPTVDVDRSVDRLEQYTLIKGIYLYDREGELCEVQVEPGRTLRMPASTSERNGLECYQITKSGKRIARSIANALANLSPEMMVDIIKDLGVEYIPKALKAIAIMVSLALAFFGVRCAVDENNDDKRLPKPATEIRKGAPSQK